MSAECWSPHGLGEPAGRALRAGALAVGLSLAASQAPDRSALAPRPAEERRFIVAVELRADRLQEFVWPHPTFPRATYPSVLLAVDEMPRIRSGGANGRLETLPAASHLRINGRFRRPRSANPRGIGPGGAPEEFVVELEAGRLRIALVLPPDVELDAGHRSVRITLYEIGSESPRRPKEFEDASGKR